jgi:hypothetical protein
VLTATNLDANGNPTFMGSAYRADGKEYPYFLQNTVAEFLTRGTPPPNKISVILVDDYTSTVVVRGGDGALSSPTTRIVSADLNTMTIGSKDASGKFITATVYDRVK